MKIHPRTKVYVNANRELVIAVSKISQDHELTITEIATMLSEQSAWRNRQMQDHERKRTSPDNTDNTKEHLEERYLKS